MLPRQLSGGGTVPDFIANDGKAGEILKQGLNRGGSTLERLNLLTSKPTFWTAFASKVRSICGCTTEVTLGCREVRCTIRKTK